MTKPIHELIVMREAATMKMAGLKTELSDIDAAITHIALPAMTDKLRLSDKEHGSLKLLVDGVELKGEILKTVRWDSAKLKDIAARIEGADAAVIFTVTLSVSEEQVATLQECEHPAIGEILLARTVKLSPFKATPYK